uniref:Putative ovule protein n=1 Tax=Solanum chacoense TaxID=4108 RepID=A0A0V0I753_SOLCH
MAAKSPVACKRKSLSCWHPGICQAKVQARLSSMPHFVNPESAAIIIYGSYSASEYCMKKGYRFSSHRKSLAQQRGATTLRRNPFSLLTSFHFLVDFF